MHLIEKGIYSVCVYIYIIHMCVRWAFDLYIFMLLVIKPMKVMFTFTSYFDTT